MIILEVYRSADKKKGGVERYISDLSKMAMKKDNKIIILYWVGKEAYSKNNIIYKKINVPKIMLKLRYVFIIYLLHYILKYIKKYNVDILHVHDYPTLISGTFASLLTTVKLYVTFHLPPSKFRMFGINFSFLPIERLFLKLINRTLVKGVCVSKYTKNRAIDFGIDPSKLIVIYNWVNDALITNNNYDKLVLFPYILYVGRLDLRQKNLYLLLDSFNIVQNYFQDLKLVMVGSGDDENEIKNYIKCLGIDNYVIFYKDIDDFELSNLYSNCVAFILVSLYEGLPFTVLEAMMNKAIVIASNVGGIPEIITNGKNGILVNFNKQIISKSIKRIYLNCEYSKKIRNCSYLYAKKMFSIKNCEKVLSIITDGLF